MRRAFRAPIQWLTEKFPTDGTANFKPCIRDGILANTEFLMAIQVMADFADAAPAKSLIL